MISTLSHKAAIYIKGKVPEHPASIVVLQYGMAFFINIFSIVFLSLIISLLTGKIAETIIAMLGFAILRQVSGGAHLKTSELCILVSVTLITLLSLSNFNSHVILLMNFLSFILVLLFAPSNIEHQTRIPTKYFGYLKLIALIMVGISFIISNPVLATAFLAQSFTLLFKEVKIK